MKPVSVTRHTTASPDRVWALATDIDGSPEVMSAIESVELLTPPPFGLGTRWRETRRIMKRDATEEMWVSAVEPARSYTTEARSHGAHYVSTFTSIPTPGGGTDITMTFTGEPTGTASRILAAVLAPLMSRSLTAQIARDLDDLVAAAERE